MSKLESAAEDYLKLPDEAIEILDVILDGIVKVDHGGMILYVNRTLCVRSGYLRGELLGQPVEMLLPESAREVHRMQHRPRYALKPTPRPMNPSAPLSMRHRTGAEIPVAIMLHPMPGGMTVAGIRFLD